MRTVYGSRCATGSSRSSGTSRPATPSRSSTSGSPDAGAVTPPASVHVQDRLAADAPVEQGVDRRPGLAPRAGGLDLAVQPALNDQPAQAGQIRGAAGVRGQLVGQVQRVDPRTDRPVEPAGQEGD